MNLEKTGRMIAAARKELNMTQKALAEKLGVSDKAISKWERGLSFPDIALLQPISQALDLPVIDLISGEQIAEERAKGVSREVVADMTDIVKSTIEISRTELNRWKFAAVVSPPADPAAPDRWHHRLLCACQPGR